MDLFVSPAVASIVRVCIDNYTDCTWGGRIYTRLEDIPIYFQNVDELFHILGDFYDCIRFPQASTISRNFTDSPTSVVKHQKKALFQVLYASEREKDKIIVKLREEDMDKKRGEQGTFIVRIQYRQNATWQGHVTWVEKNKTVPFRSALELIKMIDETQSDETEDWEGSK